MHPFLVLGLPLDADVVAIKRAYARLLKVHRPDEDPAGFQRVHEAYQACLQIASRRPAATPPASVPATVAVGAKAESAEGKQDDDRPCPEPVEKAERPAVRPSELTRISGGAESHPHDPIRETPLAAGNVLPPPPAVQVSASSPLDPTKILEPYNQRRVLSTPPSESDRSSRPLDPVKAADPAAPNPKLTARPQEATANGSGDDRWRRPEQASPPPVLLIGDFVTEMFNRSQKGPWALHAWLQAHEALYSLALKQSMTPHLMVALAKHPETLTPDCLDVLLQFFTLDRVGVEQRRLESVILTLRQRANQELARRQSWLPDFVIALCDKDREGPRVLDGWLHAHPACQSLADRSSVAGPLLQLLLKRTTPLSREGLSVVLIFFGVDEAGNNRRSLDSLAKMLESRSREGSSDGARRSAQSIPPRNAGWLRRQAQAELTGPGNWLRRLTILLLPPLGPLTCQMTRYMPNPPRWWLAAADRNRLHWQKLCVVCGPYLTMFAACTGLSAVFRDGSGFLVLGQICLFVGTAHVGVLLTRAAYAGLRRRFPQLQVRSLMALGCQLAGLVATLLDVPALAILVQIAGLLTIVGKFANEVRWLAFLSIVFGAGSLTSVAFTLQLGVRYMPVALSLSLGLPCAAVFAHDTVIASLRKLPADSGLDTGWLILLTAFWILLLIATRVASG